MVRNTVISEFVERETIEGVVRFPQNTTLYVDQFTDPAPEAAFERTIFSPRSMSEVFEQYKPARREMILENEDGECVVEDIAFNSIEDFDDDNIVAGSPFLSDCEAQVDTLSSIVRLMERNRQFRQLMTSQEDRQALCSVLEAFAAELSH